MEGETHRKERRVTAQLRQTFYYPKRLGPRTMPNEKVELERCIDYTTGAAEEEFVRDR